MMISLRCQSVFQRINQSKDLLLPREIPAETGIAIPRRNDRGTFLDCGLEESLTFIGSLTRR